ncbi:hypothetical protein AOQ84DRAFT_58376 [Glonium stellatum]|uniref:Uncharacterized protein n=1 Tax=Glonium stellatum TaxID=574774 RepID=A0A8E2JS32_9PEZI|nr:hypothetical protein AOQ84DRAFT_58376 [Glonium stellatum]
MFRTASKPLRPALLAQGFHSAMADFINYGSDGVLATSKVSIRIGDPGEAYSSTNTSSATLFHYGKLHTIALDGTEDEEFAKLASNGADLERVLEELKDM